MQSSQVIVGQTATASQHNNLREDILASSYYAIEEMGSDDTLTITEQIVGDAATAMFIDGRTSHGYFELRIPDVIDISEDWQIRIAYDMTNADPSETIRLQLSYSVIDDGGDTTPAAYTDTLQETVSTPDTAETLSTVTLSTILIPSTDLIPGALLTCRFSRLGSDAADTHTGDMRLFSLHLIQIQS